MRKKLMGCLIQNYEEALEKADWLLKTQFITVALIGCSAATLSFMRSLQLSFKRIISGITGPVWSEV